MATSKIPEHNRKVELGKLYSGSMMNVKIIDSATGKPIEIPHLQDSTRLANVEYATGTDPKDATSVYLKRTIPNDLLGQFVLNKNNHFNARSCIEALGLYNTQQILSQISNVGTKQEPYSEVEDVGILRNLTFTNYDKGGLSPRDPTTGKPTVSVDDLDPKYMRNSAQLGIGLGECTVLNPTFQFNKRDDPRTNPLSCKIGRVYSTKIMNNWPILLLQPGYLKYHTGFFKFLGLFGGAGIADTYIRSGGEGILGILSGALMTIGDIFSIAGTIGDAIFGSSKVVEFRQNVKLFDLYVRNTWITMAALMGLWDTDRNQYSGAITNLSLSHVLPTIAMGGSWITKYQSNQFLPFRIQKGMIGSETFSNSTESNPLAEQMNSTATENSEEGAKNSDLTSFLKNGLMSMLGSFSDKYAVLAGNGRIALPDVYASSSFSRSLSLSFQFHYPYGDTMGKFENVFLQFLTLLVLGLPRQTGKMTYTQPFAVRAFVKNHIYINYGMIESISVTRGGDINDWCKDGFPKTLKVDVSIKDMEPNISLPLGSRSQVGLKLGLEIMMPTSGFTEYMMSIAGYSLDELTHTFRSKRLTKALAAAQATWSNFWNRDITLSNITNTRFISNIIQFFSAPPYENYKQAGDYAELAVQQRNEQFAKSKYTDYKEGMYFTITGGGMDAFSNFVNEQVEFAKNAEKLSADLKN